MAGPQLQEECTKNYPSGIKPGDVAVTGGYNLKATKVYHGSIPKWEKGYNAKKVGADSNQLYTLEMDNCAQNYDSLLHNKVCQFI